MIPNLTPFENDYYASSERVEIAHVMPLMLGCTKYGCSVGPEWKQGTVTSWKTSMVVFETGLPKIKLKKRVNRKTNPFSVLLLS